MKMPQTLGFRLVVLITLIVSYSYSHGQQVNTVSEDTLNTAVEVKKAEKKIPKHPYAVFIMVSGENGSVINGRKTQAYFGSGLEYEGFLAGIYAIPSGQGGKKTVIFPNEFSLLYAYGGGYLGKRMWSSLQVDVDLVLNWGKGNMLWERSDTHADFIEDRFTILKPELLVNYAPVSTARLFISLGYRSIQGLKLEQVSSSDFDGLTFNFGLKVGLFTPKQP